VRAVGRYYPLALNLAGRKVVVVGGDAEAEHKLEDLFPYGPELIVVSPEVTQSIAAGWADGRWRWLPRRYRWGDLAGAALAFVSERGLYRQVRAEANARGVLLNAVDDLALCDFLAMAHFRRGGLEVAVHTSGQSAALSRRLRERLQTAIGTSYGELAAVLGALRPRVRSRLPDPARRRGFWLEVVDARLLERAEHGTFSAAELWREVEERLDALARTGSQEPGREEGGEGGADAGALPAAARAGGTPLPPLAHPDA
jgi:precorrin-2 dehydrogenase/sirohydrochlorin ferrochelatase